MTTEKGSNEHDTVLEAATHYWLVAITRLLFWYVEGVNSGSELLRRSIAGATSLNIDMVDDGGMGSGMFACLVCICAMFSLR